MANANHRIFGSTPIPRYLQLAELVRQRVAKGHWPPGSLLPSIEHLMAEFDVARVTVRQAIALLAEEGCSRRSAAAALSSPASPARGGGCGWRPRSTISSPCIQATGPIMRR